MNNVILSPKYQIVIPKGVRKSLKLKPGQKICVFQSGQHIELIPEKSLSEMRGFLKGMDNDFKREGDRM